MTSLTANTATTNTNVLFSTPFMASVSKKTTAKNYLAFSFLPKQSSGRSTAKLFSIDWDLNVNELEFE